MKKRLQQFSLLLFFIGSFLLLASCASEDRFKGQTEAQIFHGGEKALKQQDYQAAINHFEAQETRYPFGPYTNKEQLYIIYAYYMNGDYPSAQSAAERYVHLYPQASDVDYAYYFKALSLYQSQRSFTENYFPVDPALRDLTSNIAAFNAFRVLIEQYPNSPYIVDARAHMVYIRDAIARNELEVGKYYFTRKAYAAALERARSVVLYFQSTPSIAEALVLMAHCYRHLKLPQDEQATLAIIALNYPKYSKAALETV
jgi:outer membrane protein assembly factor BamD